MARDSRFPVPAAALRQCKLRLVRQAFLPMVLLGLALTIAPALWAQTARQQASKPNVAVRASATIFAPSQDLNLRVGLFNCTQARLTAYDIDLEQIAPNASALRLDDPKEPWSWRARLNKLDLRKLKRVASWTVKAEKTYPDRWTGVESKLPFKRPGAYAIVASAKGAEARTFVVISRYGLLVKRSPDKVLGWVVDAETGKPIEGQTVALYDAKGRKGMQKTDAQGLLRFAAAGLTDACYLALRGTDPAFALVGSPTDERPWQVYLFTDRPVYRPGHVVRFRGTVRAVSRHRYSFPKGLEVVHVKIVAPRGATVYEKDLELNKWGTFADEFELAPEPPLGSYRLQVEIGGKGPAYKFTHSFEVLAYRKPEFQVKVDIPKAHYLGGATIPVTISADYYFGSPVAGGNLHYEVSFSSMGQAVPSRIISAAGLGVSGAAEVESDFEGEATLDDEGKFVLEVPTKYAPVDRYMRVKAQVSELALRPQEATAGTRVTAAKFALSVRPETYVCVVGDTVVLQISTVDHDGKPVSAHVAVTIIEYKQDRQRRTYEQRTKKDVETDARGEAVVQFKPKRPGRYRVEAWARDDAGNPVYDSTSFRVYEKGQRPPYLELSANKPAYTPGDVAVLHVRTNQVPGWGLMTVEGEFLYDAQVHKISAREFDLRVPLREAHCPGITVRLAIPRQAGLQTASASLAVIPEDKRLEVLLAPDNDKYEPGQKASWAVTVRDHAGRGVEAELGVGIVDTSLYAIRPDTTVSPFDFFYSPGHVRVQGAYSLSAARYFDRMAGMGGGALAEEGARPMAAKAAPRRAGIPLTGGPSAAGPRIRKKFADTALWLASLATGPDGRARFDLEMPDNLTTWRTTARALTLDTKAGEAKKDVTVTMPLLVRLILPRFYVEGDDGTAAVIVHNYTGADRTVKVTLTAEGARLQGPPQQTIVLKKDGIERVTWRIKVLGPDRVRFVASADGGPGARDAMETTLPVLVDGVKNVQATAGVTEGHQEATLTLPADAIKRTADVQVSLSPSLAGPIFEALDYLTTYPYGCAEQTMDSFLPDVIVARTLHKLGARAPLPKNLDRYVNFGLQKLIRYQHDDGGWHWWEFDDSDPYITAYIVYGLRVAADAGYVAAKTPMYEGIPYLLEALDEEEFRAARAYLLWALTFTDALPSEALKPIAGVATELYNQRRKLDLFSRASLARSLARLARYGNLSPDLRATFRSQASRLANELDAAAQQTGVGSYWPSGTRERWSWRDNDVEVTAQVLSALLEIKPNSPHIAGAVRWLMAARRGKSWSSTKDTAAAVLALTSYLAKNPQELTPDYTARVFLGDRQVAEVKMTKGDLFAKSKTVTIPADQLKPGKNTLRIVKQGQGLVYWTARLSYMVPTEKAVPIAEHITIKRIYRVPTENPIEGGRQKSGSLIQVQLRLRVKENLRYAILEEPIPAGCEVVAGDDEPWRSPWDHREVWDNKLVFFFDYLHKGEHRIEYILRSETPGRYRILPTSAALMYFPEVRGTDRPAVMRVVEK